MGDLSERVTWDPKQATLARGGIQMTEDDHLKKLEEWQEHQYSPGYYVGKTHPLLAANRNPKLLGLSLIVAAVFLLLGVMLYILTGHGADNCLLPGGLVILSILLVRAGFRWLRKDGDWEGQTK